MSSTFQLKVFVCHLLCVCVRSPCSWVPSFEWLHTAVSGYWSSVVACDVCSAYGKERMYFYMRVGRSELHHSESRPTNGALLGVFVSACVWVSAWASFSVLASLRSCVCVCVCSGSGTPPPSVLQQDDGVSGGLQASVWRHSRACSRHSPCY